MSQRSLQAGRACVVGALAALAALVVGGTALAAPPQKETLLSTTITVPEAAKRTCFSRPLAGGSGLYSRAITAPSAGVLQARLTAGTGDWDLAVFDAKTRRTVAGSSHFGAHELAESFVTGSTRLLVQACRVSGEAATARLRVEFEAIGAKKAEKQQLVRVIVPSRAAFSKLASLGLDLTEHGRKNYVEVVLHGRADAAALLRSGFAYSVVVPDLTAASAADRSADRAFAARVARSSLPSGRTTYRRLMDYSAELKQLAAQNPDLVKGITLPLTTYEGRPVEGIEITKDPNAQDGKPVFLIMGAHHAREWPSAEHTIEWAYELIKRYRARDPNYYRLIERTRTIVIPVVNPDGFNMSREAGELLGAGNGRGGNEGANIQNRANEYRRKNCRIPNGPAAGNCALFPTAAGLVEGGVDLNRNYGGFWGGPGASTDPMNLTYRGPAPFSEPETENIRRLVSSRHVVTLITNHTFSNLVLRPPGIAAQGLSPDEPIYKALGDSMAAENGYTSQYGWQLYDTTGTTEDWSYFATGGLGFTFEIGPANFHPPYAEMIAEYEGTTAAAKGGGGNRQAFLLALRNTGDKSKHGYITGKAPKGAILRLEKTFETPTSQRNADRSYVTFTDMIRTSMVVPATGTFEWHVNPSTRPLVIRDRGRVATGPPSPPQSFSGMPGPSALPCADFDTEDETCYNDHPFEIPAGGGFDNEYVVIRMEWLTPGSDWDLKVFRDVNGDGLSAGDPKVGQSGQGPTDFEQTTLAKPEPGKYVIRVQNWAAAEPYEGTITFEGPEPYQPAKIEKWTMTCEYPAGTLQWAKQVRVERGSGWSVDLSQACK